jgi:hypothetical protein
VGFPQRWIRRFTRWAGKRVAAALEASDKHGPLISTKPLLVRKVERYAFDLDSSGVSQTPDSAVVIACPDLSGSVRRKWMAA